jgi:hypothetical protein
MEPYGWSRKGRNERWKVRREQSEETAVMRSIDTVRRGGINTYIEGKIQPGGEGGESTTVAEFIDPWLRDKVNSGIGLSYRPANHVCNKGVEDYRGRVGGSIAEPEWERTTEMEG